MNKPLFLPADCTSAFLKMGLLGFQGAGKTKTATKVAIGFNRYMRERNIEYAAKPVFFLDTETGSDWVIPDFKTAGIPLHVAKTRAFSDLLLAVREAEANGSLLIVDSVTHFWKELTEAYMKKKNRTRLEFQDWAYLKGEWGKFTDLFVNSNLHIILAGRAGYEYDYFENDAGKKELEKTGIKMKAEGEMGYEPSLLVLMEREMDMATDNKQTIRTATVLKDRSALLDGKQFTNPTFEHFLPHVELLNLGGRQLGVDTSRNSMDSISIDKRDSNPIQRKIAHDEIQTLLTLHYPSSSNDDKKAKLKAMLKHFDATWTEIESVMPLENLRKGYDTLYFELEKKPSKYAHLFPEHYDGITNVNQVDSLPDHSAAPKPADEQHAEGQQWTPEQRAEMEKAKAAATQEETESPEPQPDPDKPKGRTRKKIDAPQAEAAPAATPPRSPEPEAATAYYEHVKGALEKCETTEERTECWLRIVDPYVVQDRIPPEQLKSLNALYSEAERKAAA